MEDINKNQMELLQMKNTVSVIKKLLWDRINSRADKAGENISELKDIAIENIQNEAQREKKPKNISITSDLRNNIVHTQTN